MNCERNLAAGDVPVDCEDLPLESIFSGLHVFCLSDEEVGIGLLVDLKVLIARNPREREARVRGVNPGVELQSDRHIPSGHNGMGSRYGLLKDCMRARGNSRGKERDGEGNGTESSADVVQFGNTREHSEILTTGVVSGGRQDFQIALGATGYTFPADCPVEGDETAVAGESQPQQIEVGQVFRCPGPAPQSAR